MTFAVLDSEKLRNAEVHTEYFPYCQIDCIIKKEVLADVIKDFPKMTIRGSVPAHRLTFGHYFQQLLDDLYRDELRDIISEKFATDLSHSKPMLTVRGHTNLRDGHIHTDTPSKLMTLLLYLNSEWTEATGNLRLLKNGNNLDDYFDEVVPSAGKLLVFKVTDNCWHGHYPFTGQRQAIQFNYVTEQAIVDKEMRKHSRSYTFKKLAKMVCPAS